MRFTCQEQGLSKQTEREGDNLRKQEERERERIQNTEIVLSMNNIKICFTTA